VTSARAPGRPIETALLGPVSLDRYKAEGLDLPGGGALNVAWHWSRAGLPFRLLTRIGDDRPDLFLGFLDRHGIGYAADSIVGAGPSASIDITTREDRQPWMDNFAPGVWADFRLTASEEAWLSGAGRLHAVLVDPVVREVHRLGDSGRLSGLESSGDFLDFRHYDGSRFRETMGRLDVGFVGWPGGPGDAAVSEIRRVAFDLGRLVVVTMGSRGVLALDGASGRESWSPVEAVPVAGTTVGCGDAFIAAFLASRRGGAGLAESIGAGKAAGARATAWLRPLPDEAYGGVGAYGDVRAHGAHGA